jgi:signal recognition particle receptor subunit beta
MNEVYKIVFMGAPGSGKTTCIAALSDIPPVSTDVPCTDALQETKDTTTVALDYGELRLDGDNGRLLLYGLPGQSRFSYMFDVVRAGLFGAVVLVDASSEGAIDGLAETLETYHEDLAAIPLVVAINKSDGPSHALGLRCQQALHAHGLVAPVTTMDARRRDDVVQLFEVLLTLLEFGFDQTRKGRAT